MTTPQKGSPPNDTRELLHGLTAPRVEDPDAMWASVRRELEAPTPIWRRAPRTIVRPSLAIAAGVGAIFLGATAGALRQFVAPSSWNVIALGGAPAVAGAALQGEGVLAQGEWLETDALSSARLTVGRIGTAEVGPDSRVRMVRNGLTDHRLVLERGTLEAVIAAPPKLFFVETPAALATDLGCAYILAVTKEGASRLHVTVGWVELAKDGRRSIVPAGLVAEVQRSGVPGTPYVVDFPALARVSLARLDAGTGSDDDVARVLDAMPAPDAAIADKQRHGITLWHLAQRVDGDRRARVVRRLVALSPPPDGVTMEGILALDRQMLDRWRRDLNPMWGEEAAPPWATLGRRLWMWVMD